MPNTIQFRRGTGVPVAGLFSVGEPAWDATNSALYVKNNAGTMVRIGEGNVVSTNGNLFSGSNSFLNASGQTFGNSSSLNDGIILVGRAGGTGSFRVIFTPGTLTNNRILTLPNVSGTLITSNDSQTVTSTMIFDGSIVDQKVNASAAIAGTKINPNFGSQNVSTTGTVSGRLTPPAGSTSASTAPITLTSGNLNTTAETGAVEFNSGQAFFTPQTTSGRGAIVTEHSYATGNGSAIGPAIADFFTGSPQAINLVASALYEATFFCHFTKQTAGTVTWTLSASSAPSLISAFYRSCSVTAGRDAAATPVHAYTGSSNATTAVFAASASISTGLAMIFEIKACILTSAAANLRLRVTSSAGTVTPLVGSYYTIKRIPDGLTGNFSA